MSFEQAVTQLEQTNAELVREVVRVRDTALGLSRIYRTVSAGIDAVKDGEYFAVPGTGFVYMTLYRRVDDDAEVISEYPSKVALDVALEAADTALAKAQESTSSADLAANQAAIATTKAGEADAAATAAATSAAQAAGSATSAENSMTAAGTSASSAAASRDAAAGSAQAAATSASNAASSASAAETAKAAAEGAASDASSSKTAAASHASAAQTSATNAANSAAAAKTSETNAGASATAAQTSATNAAGSASAALSSKNAAATSASDAAASASAALASQNAAKTSEDNAAASASAAAGSAAAAEASARSADFKQYGLGTHAVTIQDANSIRESGFYKTGSSWEGSVFPGAHWMNQGVLLHHGHGLNYGVQYFHPMQNHRYYARYLDNGVWSAWSEMYNQSSILGTVSHSNGVPTGAIIERGSNANGEYVRYADGTQICTLVSTITDTVNNAFQSAFIGSAKRWDYPAQFVGTPSTSVFGRAASKATWVMTDGLQTGYVTYFNTSMQAQSAGNYTISHIAIGRWY